MQASRSVDPGSNPSKDVIFLQKLSGKSEQDFGILRKVVNSYFKKILKQKYLTFLPTPIRQPNMMNNFF